MRGPATEPAPGSIAATGCERATRALDGLAGAAIRAPDVVAGVGPAAGPLAELLDGIAAVDAATYGLLVELRGPLATKFMTSVTGLGSASAAVVFLALFYLAGWRRELAVAAVALAVLGPVVPALMGAVRRPFPPRPVCMTGESGLAPHSFPSGHAAAMTVFALVSRRSGNLPFGPVAALAAVVSVSRIYLGTHYLSDTVAGVLLGVAAFALALAVIQRVEDERLLAAADRLLPDAERGP